MPKCYKEAKCDVTNNGVKLVSIRPQVNLRLCWMKKWSTHCNTLCYRGGLKWNTNTEAEGLKFMNMLIMITVETMLSVLLWPCSFPPLQTLEPLSVAVKQVRQASLLSHRLAEMSQPADDMWAKQPNQQLVLLYIWRFPQRTHRGQV